MSGLQTETITSQGNVLWRITKQIVAFGVVVPVGFCTDFASIPRPVRIFFPLSQIFNTPPVIHDFLYATHKTSRKEADKRYYLAMHSENYGKIRAYIQWLGVRAGGWYGFYYSSPRKMKQRTPELFEREFKGRERRLFGVTFYC